MICHEPKTTRDCSVSKTTTNNMISFPFLFRYFIYRGKTTITKIYFGHVWWHHTWCFGASFGCFGVSLFSNARLVLPEL